MELVTLARLGIALLTISKGSLASRLSSRGFADVGSMGVGQVKRLFATSQYEG